MTIHVSFDPRRYGCSTFHSMRAYKAFRVRLWPMLLYVIW